MAEQEYWFARRFPVGHPRNSMSPINEKGWNVVRQFIGWMVGGAVAALIIVLIGLFVLPYVWIGAPFIFVACAMFGAWSFILASQQHGDNNHTVDDYKAGRVK
jgi:hypothetical protein